MTVYMALDMLRADEHCKVKVYADAEKDYREFGAIKKADEAAYKLAEHTRNEKAIELVLSDMPVELAEREI